MSVCSKLNLIRKTYFLFSFSYCRHSSFSYCVFFVFFPVAEKITCAKNPDIIKSRFRGVTDSTNDFGSFS